MIERTDISDREASEKYRVAIVSKLENEAVLLRLQIAELQQQLRWLESENSKHL